MGKLVQIVMQKNTWELQYSYKSKVDSLLVSFAEDN